MKKMRRGTLKVVRGTRRRCGPVECWRRSVRSEEKAGISLGVKLERRVEERTEDQWVRVDVATLPIK